MDNKLTIVYFNPDCFTDTDVTVLRYLASEFNVIWFYMYESLKKNSMRYSPDEVRRYAEIYGIKLEIVDPKMRARNPGNFFFYNKVANKMRNFKPDIVYSCQVDPFWFFSLFLIVRPKIKVIGIHDVKKHSYGFDPVKSLIQLMKDSFVKYYTTAFTFSSNQRDLFRMKYGSESIMVGMAYKSYGNAIDIPSRINEGINLLFFGTINKYKGLDTLIQSIEKLYTGGIKNIRLTIAGKGGYFESNCKQLIKTPKLYNLKVRFIDNSEIPVLFSSHHFLVLPYRDATQSGPLLTALNYNLPIIAPEFGCFIETYSSDSAFFYEPGKLTEKLREVSSITQSEYDKMRTLISSFKENFSEEIIAKNYIKAFRSLINTNL